MRGTLNSARLVKCGAQGFSKRVSSNFASQFTHLRAELSKIKNIRLICRAFTHLRYLKLEPYVYFYVRLVVD